jgi:prolyl-tRNA synthetase
MAMIMVLVLPPLSPRSQVVIVPIRQQEPGILDACYAIKDALKAEGIRVKVDDDDTKTPGWKFANMR